MSAKRHAETDREEPTDNNDGEGPTPIPVSYEPQVEGTRGRVAAEWEIVQACDHLYATGNTVHGRKGGVTSQTIAELFDTSELEIHRRCNELTPEVFVKTRGIDPSEPFKKPSVSFVPRHRYESIPEWGDDTDG